MLTINYSQRSLFKWVYAIAILLIISAIVMTFSFQVNRWLPQYTLAFSRVIEQQFQVKIYFESVHYRFPNYLILKGVKIYSTDKEKPMLQSSKLRISFAFPIFSPSCPLHNVVINDLQINFPALKNYWTQHGKKNDAWVKTLPKGKIGIFIPNGQFQTNGRTPVAFTMKLALNQDHLKIQGSWEDQGRFKYALDGMLRDSGFDVEKFTLEDGQSFINLWGSWHHQNIDWKGFVFYNKSYILDIDGHLIIDQKNIILKQLSFSIDGDPVDASGHCLKQNIFQCDANIAYRRQPQAPHSQGSLKDINLYLHTQKTPRGLSFKGKADLYFNFDKNSPASLESMHVNFEDLKVHIVNANSLKLKSDHMQSLFLIHGYQYSIPLENIWSSIDFADPYQKIIALSANTSEGHCNSRIFLDTTTLPWQIKAQGVCEGINVNRLSNNFPSFKQSHGLLSSTIELQSSPNIQLTGNLKILDASCSDSSFLAWLAKILQMPSLKHVSGANLSCRFKIDGQSKILDDLKLNTNDVDLNGFLHIDADDLVSSRMSVRFSKMLLSESPLGRNIIGLVHGAWTLPFDFSFSGNLYGINLQWNNSPLKDKVRQRMFTFFERMIDRRMDAHPIYHAAIPDESVSP